MITEVVVLGKTETVGIVPVGIAPVGIALVGIGTCTHKVSTANEQVHTACYDGRDF